MFGIPFSCIIYTYTYEKISVVNYNYSECRNFRAVNIFAYFVQALSCAKLWCK